MSGTVPEWIARWLGLDGGAGEGTVWSLESSWGWAPWITVLLVVFSVGWIGYFYAREGAALGPRARLLMVLLRLAIVVLLLLMIAELMITFQRTGLPHILVLLDESGSMSISDSYSDEKLTASLGKRLQQAELVEPTRLNQAKLLLLEDDARLLTAIESKYKLKVYFLASAARAQTGTLPEIVEKIQTLEPTGESSRLGAGLRGALADMRGSPPAAVVILTDGVTTDGETLSEAAVYARRKGVPIFTIGLGSEDPVRDVELSDLLVDEVVFVDDIVSFQATLTATGYEGKQVQIRLREKDSPSVLAETRVTLGRNGEPQKIRVPYRPTAVGEFEYVLEAVPLEGELQNENNRLSRLVSVRKEQIRVLLVQAYPNYEFRYLKNMLARDSTIKLKTVLQEADLKYAKLDETALSVFPVRREELFEYDVLIFGDVNPAFFSDSVLNNIREFVEQKGGGLVFVAGPQYTPKAYRDTPLAALMPFDVARSATPDASEVLLDGYVGVPTDLGLASPQMQLGDSPSETLTLWRNLPPMFWLLEMPHLKPAARVLLEHPSRLGDEGRKLPILLMHYVGAGKVLFHGTDETWRWRFRLGDVLFARYWVQTIRYLARSKLLGGERKAELTADRREYRRGEPVQLRVRFVDERLAPASEDGVSVVLEQQGRKSRRVKLRRNATSPGIFEAVVTGLTEGNYHAWMAVPTLEGRAPAADFLVTAPPGEFQRLEMDAADLARTAEQSRGKFYRLAEASHLLADLPKGRQIPVETLPPKMLWNRSGVLILFVGMLVTEWILRKRRGLL